MALSLIDLFSEAVLRWSLRCDRPVQELTSLVMLATFGGRPDAARGPGAMGSYDVEGMRLALHSLTVEPGLREDFLVRSLIRELSDVLEDQLENFGRNKARARARARRLESVLSHPALRERYLIENGLADRQADALLAELQAMAAPEGALEELARRKRALDAWHELAEPVLAPDLLREWRAEQLALRGEMPLVD